MNLAYLKEMYRFDGKTVWVIGGAGYLGGPAVVSLAQAGARVLCADLPGAGQRLLAESAGQSGIITKELNAFDLEAVRGFIDRSLQEWGTPDGLLHLTTGSSGVGMEKLTPEAFDQSNHRSLTCAFEFASRVGQAMVKEQKGSIVLTSSMYGNIAPKPDIYHLPMEPNPLDYGVCKAGVQAMARYFCAMWGREGIRCNSLSPGPFPHDQLRKSEPGFIERLASRTPAQRVGRREEIAGPAVFLLSDASTYVNGQNLLVDGGWTAW